MPYPKTPPVGSSILFYVHADTLSRPIPAIVQEITSDNPPVLVLSTLPGSHRDWLQQRMVRHVSDPVLEQEKLRIKYGGWDTIEAGEQRRQGEIDKQRDLNRRQEQDRIEKEKRARDEDEFFATEAAELYRKGMPAVDIADHMNRVHGGNWSYQRINGLLKRKKVLQPV